MTAWQFTRHADERLAAMGLTRRDVLAVLLRPQVSYQQTRGGHLWQRDGIGVVTARDEPVVITVLWNVQHRYLR
jgi:hypothetical protein